jgi:nicotinate dehydrogenase subunit A
VSADLKPGARPKTAIALTLNGKPVSVSVGDDDTLLHALRERLGLKGTRFGCGAEACGACMVLLDGVPKPSCTTRAADLAGHCVETADGLAMKADSRGLQEAFIEEQAGQCGYCLSGILMSATALLRRIPNPTRADVTAALEPHLCRCGAHNRIIRAVLRAAAERST